MVFVNAQTVSIPDAVFKARLLAASDTYQIAQNSSGMFFKIDANNNGQIEVNEALAVYWLDIGRIGSDQTYISNLTGINSFSNLKFLRCSNNTISSFNFNGLTSLEELYCSFNSLTAINVTPYPNLKNLDCSANQISTITLGNSPNLELLYCTNNQLTAVNWAAMPNLKSLDCGSNLFTTLDLSANTSLTYLGCTYLGLQSLNVTYLVDLVNLVCGNNQLTQLDISGLTKLRNLQCGNNLIEYIDLSDIALAYPVNQGPPFYELRYNNLRSITTKNGRLDNFGMIAEGNPNLLYACCDESEIGFLQEYYPNCNINSYCSFTPGGITYSLQGNQKLDFDANGCDSNDISIPNLKFTIVNETTIGNIISNATGNYAITVSPGNYTITPTFENPAYYTASPTSIVVNFPAQQSPINQNFCITPNGLYQDVETWIIPVDRARPGFESNYKIFYRNKGTVTISGSLTFAFDDNVMDFISASPIQNSQSLSLLNWNYADLLPFQTRYIEVKLRTNAPTQNPSVNFGDVLKFSSTIFPLVDDGYSSDNSNDLRQIVVNSLDPNDKTCVEGTTILPEMIGEYVHYLIRFENTGTADAQNIVVSDIIDTTKFDISSLVPLSGSASFVTNIKNTNKVEFIFENINLPFDDANNDGYVAFKIKTNPTLVLGDTFSNSANIYFDYNFPILTNTYSTTITALGTQDFDFSNVFSLSPVPTKDVLTITTKQAAVISSVNIYNTLGQLLQVNTNPNETIDVSGLKTGNYFIKIMSDKGTASSKFIKE